MSEEKRLVPYRRFKGFTDDWEQRKLGDNITVFDGTHQTPNYVSSGVKFVSVENIADLNTEKYITYESYIKEYKNKKAQKGDVLMTRIGDIGTTKVIETSEDIAYYVTLSLLKPKFYDSFFLSNLLCSNRVKNDIWKRTLHIAFPKKINLSEIKSIALSAPKIEEQIEVGKLLKLSDKQITLHQRKHFP